MESNEIIEQLNNLDLSLATEEDVISIIHQYGRAGAIITKLHETKTVDSTPHLFVRATNYDPKKEKISSTDRLRYPPIEYNTQYQRASTPDKPMFYGVVHKSAGQPDVNSAIRTCLLETISDYDELLNSGSRVAISLRYNISELNLYSVFGWKEFQSRNPKMRDINQSYMEALKHTEPESLKNTEHLLNYLAERFYIPVGENADLYKPSATLTQYLLEKMMPYGIDGIIFPSTKVDGQELNVAINPITSDEKLVVTKVLDCEYKPNRIVEIQHRANIQYGSKEVNFSEEVKIEIDLK